MQRINFFKNSSNQFELTPEESETLKAIETAITCKKKSENEKLASMLINYPAELLQKFFIKSEKFKNFCLHNDCFNSAISEKLKEYNYINMPITSMDRSESFSLFQIFMAAQLFSLYNIHFPKIRQSSESRMICNQALELACQFGLFIALIARCENNIARVSSTSLSHEEKEKCISAILADTKRLSNLYWAFGYVQAGCILRELVEKLLLLGEEKNRITAFFEEHIKCLLCATLLADHQYSKEVANSLTDGGGLNAEIKKAGLKIETQEDAKLLLKEWSGGKENFDRIQACAQAEINSLLKNSNESKPSY
ncbi:MAG TPA: hypothetical protein VHA13_04475 [Gammaproteobacteria bacterium]|nr:hypothetical protein [Gammaproteobacteria bacterium]